MLVRPTDSLRYFTAFSGKTGLLTGRSGIFHLSHLWQTHLSLLGQRVLVIDCAIRFNAFYLADEAMRMGLQTEALLQSILVQRAFTPYQILDVLYGILDAAHKPPDSTYFLLAPFKQFFDGDVSDEEGRFLLKKLTSAVSLLQRESIPLLIVEKDSYSHPSFAPAFEDLKSIASIQWRLTDTDGIFSVRIEQLPMRQASIIHKPVSIPSTNLQINSA
ncbi:MAG TPA: hypothetical protein PKE49_09620 [Leptospiraceae bacterium]|nr:hypothetical protein [Leptospiraceae bacterium]HMY44626.1 hypothetical protein [Leptospiraceae bacterium]HMZ38065.1 hypothetical protein [Leptospiraceae bacterium]HNJ33142.1 hypothetical protein [Leptospiraceae bacterium]HNL68497.1 hypothetical protein [Leptospiraceae bacterium]